MGARTHQRQATLLTREDVYLVLQVKVDTVLLVLPTQLLLLSNVFLGLEGLDIQSRTNLRLVLSLVSLQTEALSICLLLGCRMML
jgi:hypothetical protein